MAIFAILLYAGNPKGLTGFHVNIITSHFGAPLALELHQSPPIEV